MLLKNESNLSLTTEKLYFRAHSYFFDLLQDIQKSKLSIDIEMYIWSTDEIGQQLYLALKQAVKRGVKVRIVVDGIGSFYWIQWYLSKFLYSGIEIKIFHPLLWSWSIFKFTPHRLWIALNRINRRNHRKFFLIDQKIIYTGSLNIMKSSFFWRETGIRLTGDPAILIHKIFEDTWAWTTKIFLHYLSPNLYSLQNEILSSGIIRSNQSFHLRKFFRADLLTKFNSAQNRIWLMTPYFVPPGAFLKAILAAAERGVDVRIIVPFRSDIRFICWVANLYYRYLIRSGVSIYEYSPQILHAKMAIIDNWGMVGSSNFNHRSTYLDLELDIAITKKENFDLLEQQLYRDMELSNKIIKYKPLTKWKFIIARILIRLKRWF